MRPQAIRADPELAALEHALVSHFILRQAAARQRAKGAGAVFLEREHALEIFPARSAQTLITAQCQISHKKRSCWECQTAPPRRWPPGGPAAISFGKFFVDPSRMALGTCGHVGEALGAGIGGIA